MPEFPSIPMRSNVSRSSQFIEAASSSWAKLTLYIYADTNSMWPEGLTGNHGWEFVVHEVDGNSNYNWVRTVGTVSGTVNSSSGFTGTAPGLLLGTGTLNLNTDSSVYYVIQGSVADTYAAYGSVSSSVAEGMNGYSVTQADSWSTIDSGGDTDITDSNMIAPGSGFPSATYGTAVAYDMSFRPSHNGSSGDSIWISYNWM